MYNLIKLFKSLIGVHNYLLLKKKLGFSNLGYNNIQNQRKWSQSFLKSNNQKEYSNHWGKIDQYNEGLGDYRIVKDKLVKLSESNKSVLEIGCLDGKWSKVLIDNFKDVHLIDLDDKLVPLLRKKFGNDFKFYTTKGNELSQLNNNSVDLIFSMDSLVRVPKKSFFLDYLKEFKRVLKNNGQVYVHLPCNSKVGSIENDFTFISKNEIIRFSKKVGLEVIDFDEKTLEHGILLNLINKTVRNS
jgi:ubiquinone/menaquinone biosynthesis C-methylase UbiE